jgi:hypothetical protein
MKKEDSRTCPSCGNEFSGALEFCPVFQAGISVIKKIKLTVVTGTDEWFLFSES